MAHYPSDIRRQRILREQNEILALEQRIEEARRTRDATVHAFERSQAVMHDAIDQLSALCARCETAREELSELRLSYRRDLMGTLPLDVLGCIFGEVASLPPGFIDCLQYTDGYLRDATRAPFALAAVCRRWRAQALCQPFLWTCISTPDLMDDAGIRQHRQRITLVLQRSKSCPLDIFLFWVECGRDENWNESPSLEIILKPLLSCALRWRTFQLVLPDGVGKAEYTYALNGPLPLLEYFRFISIEKDNHDPEAAPSSFPFAPRLREMTVWGPNSVLPHALGFPSLRNLRLWFHLPLEKILPLLSAVSPTLESLAIGLSRDVVHLSDAQLELPKLTTLTLDLAKRMGRACQQLGNMRMPAMQHLLLTGNSIFADLSPIVDQVAAKAHTLTLGDTITPQHIDVVGRLTSIRTLIFDEFTGPGEPMTTYKVPDAFFAALAENADVWPRLERVEFRKAGTLELGSGSGVLSFVRSRTRRDAETPCKLRAFDVPNKVPEWLKAEVARLLQD